MADRIGQMALLNDHTWLGSKGWRFDGVQDVLQDLLHGGARALFTCVPTVKKATLAASVGAADAGVALGQELAALLAGFAAPSLAAREALVPAVGRASHDAGALPTTRESVADWPRHNELRRAFA